MMYKNLQIVRLLSLVVIATAIFL